MKRSKIFDPIKPEKMEIWRCGKNGNQFIGNSNNK
tara:strand:+ start:121 stop:225 length:105 start_codon:yes stop_codon:yes gene_type:complete